MSSAQPATAATVAVWVDASIDGTFAMDVDSGITFTLHGENSMSRIYGLVWFWVWDWFWVWF
jgi:hypothetical protein